jgi:hypothetical protein
VERERHAALAVSKGPLGERPTKEMGGLIYCMESPNNHFSEREYQRFILTTIICD